jgi:hypothetical protein
MSVRRTAHFSCTSKQEFFLMDASNDEWIGIDLGTTYSCVAYFDPTKGIQGTGGVVVCANNEGEKTTPSMVGKCIFNLKVSKGCI